MSPFREMLAELKAIRRELAGIRAALETGNKIQSPFAWMAPVTTGTTAAIPWTWATGSSGTIS